MVFKKILGSSRELLLRSFDGAFGSDDWRPLLDFVSPSFFDVVPLRDLLSQGRSLVSNAADGAAREQVRSRVSAALRSADTGVALVQDDPAPLASASEEELRAGGQRVIEVYFAQLYASDATLFDLRASRFSPDASRWSPGPYFVRWDPAFLDALRTLYTGFYRGRDDDFAAALRELNLSGSQDLFEKHFGEDPESVVFDRKGFVDTFHEVFVRCRDEGVKLHRDFLPLGIYLAALHEHLAERGGGPFRVRTAFERAVSRRGSG